MRRLPARRVLLRTEVALLAPAAVLGGIGLGLMEQGGIGATLCAAASCVLLSVWSLIDVEQDSIQDSRSLHRLLKLAPLCVAAILLYASLSGQKLDSFVSAAAVLGLSLSAAHWLARRYGQTGQPPGSHASGRIGSPTHVPGDILTVTAPGELQDDCSILSGDAQAKRWPGAVVEKCIAGQTLFAGAKIETGQVQVRVHWTGEDRCSSRLLSGETGHLRHRTAELHHIEALTSRWAMAAGLAAASAALLNGIEPLAVAMATGLAVSLFSNSPLHCLAARLSTATVNSLLDGGIFFRDGAVFDRAALAPSVVLSATSSLLHNTPRVDQVEPLFGSMPADEMLALAAGCFTTSESTMGTALRQAVFAGNLKIPPVRSAHYLPGLGVVGVSAQGKPVVVGSRNLLLAQKISVARAEPQIEKYEQQGQTVVLVAVGGHLAGLVSLRDQLRPGTQRAVQLLQTAGIEAILMSGDSRQTCEALARESGVTHIRPEIDPNFRDDTLHALAIGRKPLAFIGRSSIDGNDLREIEVPINLDSQGAPLERWPVQVASGLIHDAAWGLVACRQLRAQLQQVTRYHSAAAIVGTALVAAGGPLWLAPLALGFGTFASAAHLEFHRNRARKRTP